MIDWKKSIKWKRNKRRQNIEGAKEKKIIGLQSTVNWKRKKKKGWKRKRIVATDVDTETRKDIVAFWCKHKIEAGGGLKTSILSAYLIPSWCICNFRCWSQLISWSFSKHLIASRYGERSLISCAWSFKLLCCFGLQTIYSFMQEKHLSMCQYGYILANKSTKIVSFAFRHHLHFVDRLKFSTLTSNFHMHTKSLSSDRCIRVRGKD